MDQDAVNDLLQNPAESTGVEFKSWLDLNTLAGLGKVVRALLALRNNNGGSLVIGFDDKTREPVEAGRPADVAAAFHPDVIQLLVKNHCRPPFEVDVRLGTRDEKKFPVLVVGPGVRGPVISRQQVTDKGVVHVRQNAVYMRSVKNGTVESTEPRTAEDWDTLFEICFDNREADIGRFLRRHAPALIREVRGPETAESSATLQLVTPVPPSTLTPPPVLAPNVPPAPRNTAFSLPSQPVEVLEEGAAAYAACIELRKTEQQPTPPTKKGWREIGVVCDGPLRLVPAPKLLEELFIRHPRLSGVPAWTDTRGAVSSGNRPYPNRNGWEALIQRNSYDYAEPMVDFWRLEPAGSFYLQGSYEDDVFKQVEDRHGKVLDFVLVIARAADALGTAQAFGRTLSADSEQASIRAAFRWTGLRHRELASWVEPMRDLWMAVPAHEAEITSQVTVPLSMPLPALALQVEKAVKPLFAAFGVSLSSAVVQKIAAQTLTRA